MASPSSVFDLMLNITTTPLHDGEGNFNKQISAAMEGLPTRVPELTDSVRAHKIKVRGPKTVALATMPEEIPEGSKGHPMTQILAVKEFSSLANNH